LFFFLHFSLKFNATSNKKESGIKKNKANNGRKCVIKNANNRSAIFRNKLNGIQKHRLKNYKILESVIKNKIFYFIKNKKFILLKINLSFKN